MAGEMKINPLNHRTFQPKVSGEGVIENGKGH